MAFKLNCSHCRSALAAGTTADVVDEAELPDENVRSTPLPRHVLLFEIFEVLTYIYNAYH